MRRWAKPAAAMLEKCVCTWILLVLAPLTAESRERERRPRLYCCLLVFALPARQPVQKTYGGFFFVSSRRAEQRAINSLTLAVFAQQRSNGTAPLRPKDAHFRVSTAFVCICANAESSSLHSHSRARLINKLNTIQLPDIDVKWLFTSNHSAAAACCAVCLPIKFNCAYAFIVPAEEEEDKNAGNFPTQAHCFVKVSAGGIVLSLLPAFVALFELIKSRCARAPRL